MGNNPPRMQIIDTHCHIDVPAFDPDRQQVLARARALGVSAIVVPGIHAAGWRALLALCAREADLHPALGLHPVYLDRHLERHLDDLGLALEREKPVAVGEIGLDYFVRELDRKRQQRLFEAQLGLARDHGLPVLLHVRKAHEEVLRTLRRIRVPGGICHAFNGGLQQAFRYIELGFKLGFGGMLTYERSTRLRALGRDLPLAAIVLETDAPDMTVAAHQGARNSPEYLPDCLAALVEVRGESLEQIARQTTRSAQEVLHLGAQGQNPP